MVTRCVLACATPVSAPCPSLPQERLGINSGTAADDHIAYVRTLQQAQATLIYDHNDKTVTADSDDGPIRITIRR